MKISEMITDRYKLRIPPTVYYELLADVQEVEEEQETTTKNNLGVDCVARQDVERYIEGFINEYTPREELEFINLELDGLKHIPSVTPQEPKTGHWITHHEGMTLLTGETATGGVVCSECGYKTHNKAHVLIGCPYKYCPDCGAKMEGEE